MGQITISRSGGPVSVQIVYGYERAAAYIIELQDPDNTPVKHEDGETRDRTPVVVFVDDPSTFEAGYRLSTVSNLAAVPPDSDPSGMYSVTTWFSQKDWNIPESPDRDQGKLDGGKAPVPNVYDILIVP